MKKKTPILDLYRSFCTKGIPIKNGLCFHFEFNYAEFWGLIEPNQDELDIHVKEGNCESWWADGIYSDGRDNAGTMTPLRETIVLFMAAMNGELDKPKKR